ncbi:hypothetical protein ACXN5S_11680 [Pseudoroseicyclus sp. H15]
MMRNMLPKGSTMTVHYPGGSASYL